MRSPKHADGFCLDYASPDILPYHLGVVANHPRPDIYVSLIRFSRITGVA
jgi:hypothetical protein